MRRSRARARRWRAGCAVVSRLSLTLLAACAHQGRADEPLYGYERRAVVDSRVFVNAAVPAHGDDAQRALSLLQQPLAAIKRALPRRVFEVVARAAIWIEWEAQSNHSNFHPSARGRAIS